MIRIWREEWISLLNGDGLRIEVCIDDPLRKRLSVLLTAGLISISLSSMSMALLSVLGKSMSGYLDVSTCKWLHG